MEFHGKHSVCVMLMSILLCTAGCAAADPDSTANRPKATDLPPLITDASETVTEDTQETTTFTTTELPMARYQAKAVLWDLPDELGALQAVRTYGNDVYLLGVRQNEAQQLESVLYCADAESDPEFVPLYANADHSAFIGLTDFDVLSDGTVCGLLCENIDAVPYENPTFDPDQFDWESYYENYATQYQLVWYDQNGVICKKMGLSTLLDLDETARQTMAFTGVRCDASDHIYLTATIDEVEYLMALDDNGNLCPVQGSGSSMLSLESDYQWIRCGTDGMLFQECDTDDVQQMSHVVITDGALWKTQMTLPEQMTAETMLAESEEDDLLCGMWDQNGLYRLTSKNTKPELLYHWRDAHLDASKIDRVLILPNEQVVVMTFTAQGELSVEFLTPNVEAETNDVPEENSDNSHSEKVPVATPVRFS